MEPAHHAVHSLLLVTQVDHLSGLGEWVIRTADSLSPSGRNRSELVIVGFYNAIMPGESRASFPAYVDRLATRDPNALRDRLLKTYARIPPLANGPDRVCIDEAPPVDLEAMLKNVDSYLDFLRARFDADKLDEELEAQAYAFIVDPPAMQDLIVTHLRKMWNEYLAEEWARVEPMLQDSVRAFDQVDLGRMDRQAAVQWVTGQELGGKRGTRCLRKRSGLCWFHQRMSGPTWARSGRRARSG
jgi:hypothetical protein